MVCFDGLLDFVLMALFVNLFSFGWQLTSNAGRFNWPRGHNWPWAHNWLRITTGRRNNWPLVTTGRRSKQSIKIKLLLIIFCRFFSIRFQFLA